MKVRVKMARLKKVFKRSYDVAHCWAQRTQSEGRSHNCFFENDTIYSYGYHFPMARFADKNTVLVTTRTYSPTTAKHIHEVKSAIRAEYKQYHVCNVKAQHHKEDHVKNIELVLAECDALYTLAAKAVKKTSDYLSQAEKLIENVKEYSKHFKVGYRFKAVPNLEVIKDRLKKQAAATKIRKAKENQEKIETQNRFLADILPLWKANKPYMIDDREVRLDKFFRLFDRQFLRIEKRNKDSVIVGTSLEVKLPVKAGGKMLDYVEKLVADCKECIATKTPKTMFDYQLGAYRINSIDNLGTVTVGCHTLPWSEIESILTGIK
jgi:hypothetical protein